MFVRDSLTASMALQQNTGPTWLGDAMDNGATADVSGQDPLLVQLHQIALVIVALRQQADSLLNQLADASNDSVSVDQLTTLMQQIAAETATFAQVAAQRTAQNPYALSWPDQAILDIGNWAQGFLNALPGAIAAIPDALVDALTRIIGHTGGALAGAVIPWAAVAVGVGALLLLGARKGETTRTYRKYVA